MYYQYVLSNHYLGLRSQVPYYEVILLTWEGGCGIGHVGTAESGH